jgi:hypothetical protein
LTPNPTPATVVGRPTWTLRVAWISYPYPYPYPSEVPPAQRRKPPGSLCHYEKTCQSRDEAIVRAYASGGYSMKDIGPHFGLHYSRISRIISKYRKAKGKT